MSTIKGIFEPFKDYVQKQLRVRKVLLSNAHQLYIDDGQGGQTEGSKELGYGFNLDSRSNIYPESSFFAYTTEKQCIIKMMSGVNLRSNAKEVLKEEAADPNLNYLLYGGNLAKQYILEGGTQYYDEKGKYGGLREGFIPDNVGADYKRAFSYGDRNIRANPDKDYGIVPMPGIIDAEIRTKSDNGSIREAQVNFVCHNRKQLEILELLYMRPGYPIYLEWGWNPYIDNNGNRQENNFTIREEFFNPESTLESLNEAIRENKTLSGGNMDGFIGYCKNFKFKANEIGGYECTTEIIAHGEILESLQSQKTYQGGGKHSDESKQIAELEIQDSFLFYLRSIKNTLRSPSDLMMMKHMSDDVNDKHLSYEGQADNDPTWEDMLTPLGYVGEGCPSYFRNQKLVSINYTSDYVFQCIYENNVVVPVQIDDHQKWAYKSTTTDDDGNVISETSYRDIGTAGWKPQAYDFELQNDITEEIELNADYIKNMTFDQYQFQFEGDNTGFDPMGSKNSIGSEGHYMKLMAKTYVFGGLNEFMFNLKDFIYADTLGKWGIQREGLVQRGVKAQSGDFVANASNRIDGINELHERLHAFDRKLFAYNRGYIDVKNLWQFITKASGKINRFSAGKGITGGDFYMGDPEKPKKMLTGAKKLIKKRGIGLHTYLGGSIIEQVIKKDSKIDDSGYNKNIYIRWDLLCQMINHLSTYKNKANMLSSLSNRQYAEGTLDLQSKQGKLLTTIIDNYQLKHPSQEFTYMNPNKRTWNNNYYGKKDKQYNSFYLPYTAPYVTGTDPIKEMYVIEHGDPNTESGSKPKQELKKDIPRPFKIAELEKVTGQSYLELEKLSDADLNALVEANKSELAVLYTEETADVDVVPEVKTKKIKLTESDYHPIIGSSLDENICLMPHQDIFDDMFTKDKVYYDSTPQSDKVGVGATDTPTSRREEDLASQDVDMQAISSFVNEDGKDIHKSNDRHSIGYVYFNLDYLIQVYENQRLKDIQENEILKPHTRLNKDFNFFDYVTTIWNGVNSACGNYYNFVIHTEHERPHINRIIDMRVSGKTGEDSQAINIYEFEPQGLRSVTRQFYYDSAISNDLASTIAIAASDPKDMNDLDSLSFKAFNKNIRNRFNSDDEIDEDAVQQELTDNLIKDIEKYTETFNAVTFYLNKLHEGNHQTETIKTSNDTTIGYISTSTAMTYMNELAELRTNINNRVPLKDKNGKINKDAGRWLTEVNTEISPIIPIQFNMQLDGIAGMIPLQLFKIHKDRLPIGYQNDAIAFVIKSESHKITSTQDWTVSLSGQMVLLNNTVNRGSNTLENAATLSYNTRSSGTSEQLTNNADLVRNVIRTHGHVERSHVGKKKGYNSGELSSHADITSELRVFLIDFIKSMKDPEVAGFDHNLSAVRLEFTGGNDIYHQQKKYKNSKHRVGKGIDFIVKSSFNMSILDEILTFIKELKSRRYPSLYIKDEYRVKNFDNGIHKDVYGRPSANAPAHVHLHFP